MLLLVLSPLLRLNLLLLLVLLVILVKLFSVFFPAPFFSLPVKWLKLLLRHIDQLTEIQRGKGIFDKVGKVIILRIFHKQTINIGFHPAADKIGRSLYLMLPVLCSGISKPDP